MMKLGKIILIFLVLGTTSLAFSQDTLPKFTAKHLGSNTVQISWVNPYQTCIQLNVQRSFDSTKNFKTIFSTQSPELPMNGFADKAPYHKMYYRIFYVLQGGAYFFTKSKQPDTLVRYVTGGIKPPPRLPTMPVFYEDQKNNKDNRYINIFIKDSLIATLDGRQYRRFKDSIANQTKDTLFALNQDAIELRRVFVWKPSMYVFTNNKGYVTLSFPLVKKHIYRLVIMEQNGTEVFQIKHIKEASLVLDKSNFPYAGWYNFELYEDDKLKERNKFLLEDN
jgi:hypothetical protein